MKKLSLITLFITFLGFAQATQANVIFSCKTENNKYIEINRINNNLYEYKFGSASKNEITIRNKKSELLGRSSKWDGIGRGRWAVMVFQNGEYLYNVTVNFDSIEHTVNSGVFVERKGKEIARVECTPETAQGNFDDDNFAW
ncbi:hypothetical protein [Glaesserella sp.]|uniref:hypothetical protein n=1 Tax=Glaesserella sp. TaxID=2094731 RepID=UPI0035A08B53